MNPSNDEVDEVIAESVKKSLINDLKEVTNNFERANLFREAGFILFQESANDEDLASLVLHDVLDSYRTVVTSTGENSVNNYTDRVAELLKKSQRAIDVTKWKPVISRADVKEEDVTNKCKGTYEDCRHREVTQAALNTFHRSLNNKTPKRKLDEANDEKDEDENDINFADKSIFENEQFPGISEMPVSRQGCSKIKSNQQNEVKLSTDLFRKTDRAGPSEGGCRKAVEEPARNIGNSFRTARDELSLQNLRKYGKRDKNEPSCSNAAQNQYGMPSNSVRQPQSGRFQHHEPQQPLFSYGASKKSLGARRTVQSKFIPPVKNNDEASGLRSNTGSATGENETDATDERLKNIEAKMIELISNEIMTKFKPVSWNDIAGLNYAKATIQEAVVWPMLRPDIFTGLRRPPRGILLFGPPGTGKTLIGKCIASQSQSTFFSISASSLTSKWIGDGEKMVRALFAVAAVHQPSVIFIDEVDSLLCQRSETEHESSRRIKTEFLVQLDGAMTSEEERILIVGATNRPQELDEAARRRFTRRLYIPLPEQEARLQILKNLLQSVKHSLTEMDIENIGKLTCGYSGADMESLCREASMEPIRSIPPDQILYFNENEVRPINFADFRQALSRIRASVSQNDLQHYVRWNEVYGSGISL